MAKRTEVPSARSTLLEELDEVDPGEVEGTEPAEGETGATPQARTEAPADGAESAEELEGEEAEAAGAEGTEAEGAPPQQEPPAWQPPEGGQPLRFRADHREVDVPGALEWDHGVYIPKEAWNTVVSRHLADREQFYQTLQGLQRQVDERDPEKHPRVLQADVTIKKFLELFDKGPEAVAQWLDNYAVNRPLLEAEIRNATLEAQLQAQSHQVGDAEFQATVRGIQEQLPGYVEQNIAALITQVPEFQGLKGSEKKLVEQFWPFLHSILMEADRDYPEYGVAQGQIVVRREVLEQLLRQETGRRAELKRLEAAGKHNAAATGKAKPSKTVPSRGRPVPAGPKREYKPGETQQAKDDFLNWDPMADGD